MKIVVDKVTIFYLAVMSLLTLGGLLIVLAECFETSDPGTKLSITIHGLEDGLSRKFIARYLKGLFFT